MNRVPEMAVRIEQAAKVSAALAFGLIVFGCVATSPRDRESGVHETAESTVEALVRDWYGSFSRGEAGREVLLASVAPDDFTIEMFGTTISNAAEWRAWRSTLSSDYTSVIHEIASIDVDVEASGHYRAQVDVTRRAVDREGLTHIARRAQTWSFRRSISKGEVVERITETRLVPSAGTGAQVMCF